MRNEHMTRGGNDFVFVTGNYKLRTKAHDEWLYVVGDEGGRRVAPPASDMGHGRVIQPIDELLRKPLAQAAKLTREEMIAVVMYTGPAFVLYNAVLRQFPADIYNVFKDGDNLFPTTIFVLVSAVNKLSRCMNIPHGTLLYRGLCNLEFPDRFTRADKDCGTPNALGFLEYGFMSTTAEKNVAVQYSGVKQGKPRASILQISPNSVDRGADISEFSQYPGEKEFLFVPYSFIQGEGRQRTEVVAGGGVLTVVPVRVNINLKTETVDELKEKKKRLHLVSARAMVEEVRYELGEWAKSTEAAVRLQKDPTQESWYQDKPISTATLADIIVKQCEDVVKRHEAATLQEYVDDGSFRALVGEMLDTKSWAKEKKELWMRDASNYISHTAESSLRESHRGWLGFLTKFLGSAAAGSPERKFASLQFLSSRGLALQGVDKKNVDGEGVMVQAGADGWQARDIAAAAAAGADVNAASSNGITAVTYAAMYGNADSLAALLSAGGDFKQYSSVIGAAANGHSDCLKLLVAAGGDVNNCSDDGFSPIYLAAQNGHGDCLKLLLAAGGDVNKCINKGASPIYTAAEIGRADCLKLLLDAGGDVNKCTDDGVSPISAATQNGRADCLKLLLAVGGDVNKCNKNGASPIYTAAQNGRADCLKLLLDAGGDFNKCDDFLGFPPIFLTAGYGHADCLKLLLAARADPRISCSGQSVLDAAREEQHVECMRLLEAALT